MPARGRGSAPRIVHDCERRDARCCARARRRTAAPRACANGNEPSGSASASAVTRRTPSLVTCFARARARDSRAGAAPARARTRCACCRATARRRRARTAPGERSPRTCVARPQLGGVGAATAERRLDRLAGAARRRGSRARAPACAFARASAAQVRGPAAAEAVEDRCRARPRAHAPASTAAARRSTACWKRGRVRDLAVAGQAAAARRRRVREQPSSRAGTASPAGSAICPTSRDGSKSAPAIAGASQSAWSRVQSQAHAAFGLSGSCPAGLNAAQPHDQTLASRSSAATCCAASASHLTTSSQLRERLQPLAAAGLRRRAESEHRAEPVRRHADLDQVLDPAAASSRAGGGCRRRRPASQIGGAGEVDLAARCPRPAHARRHQASAPRRAVYGRLGEQQERPRAALRRAAGGRRARSRGTARRRRPRRRQSARRRARSRRSAGGRSPTT